MARKHKAREDYCLRHEIPFPHFNRLPGRPIKPSPLYDRLKAKGDVERHDHFSCRRKVVHDMVGNECRAVRTGVGIMDISAVAKVEVTGPGAEAFLDRMVANRLPQKVGGIALTHMLHRRGRIELETTFVKLGAGWCYLVFAAFFEQRLLDHLAQHQVGEDAQVILRSNDWAALTLNGPKSRAVLGACTDADLSNAGFRWLSAQEITVAGHKLWAFRMSYAGELGWEFHILRDAALAVYDAHWTADEGHGIADYGSFAMNALRTEKGFKGAGELTNEVTQPEADVMRSARLDKDYLGAEQTRVSAAADLPCVCAYLEIEPKGGDDDHGGEAAIVAGTVIGSTASVAFGHSVGQVLAFAYIKPHADHPGTDVQVVIAGETRSGRILGAPAYDPDSKRPRADVAMEVAE